MAGNDIRGILFHGVDAWNDWRRRHPRIQPDLSGLDLSAEALLDAGIKTPLLKYVQGGVPEAPTDEFVIDLRSIDFSDALLIGVHFGNADLSNANMARARLADADLTGAALDRVNLLGADLNGAKLVGARVRGAKLCGSSLHKADLWHASFVGSDLTDADLTEARILFTDFSGATLVDCRIYGAALWDINLTNAVQKNFIVESDANITVDNLALAQIFHVIKKNQGLIDMLDVLSRKVVLILGRFSTIYKPRLDAIGQKLRTLGYQSSIFDVPNPETRNMTETVSALGHLSRFVIADISEPRSVPQELQHLATNLVSVPIVPLLAKGEKEWAMFRDLLDRPQVLDIVHYADTEDLLARFEEAVVAPAEAKARAMHAARAARQTASAAPA
jgi:uncharacterized protein YjbI with pentapeptide repeats